MSFRYTAIGALMNEDKFADAAKLLVDEYVTAQFAASEQTGEPVEVEVNSSAVARKLGVTYRTINRWLAVLLEHGHDAKKQAKAEIERRLKEKKAAA